MKTDTLCLMPILGCLDVAAMRLAIAYDDKWVTYNDDQKLFCEKFWQFREKLAKVKELRSKSDWNVDVINEWLKGEGFDIVLEKREGEQLAVASVLKLIEEWQKIGTKRDVHSDNTKKSYPGVLLKSGGIAIYHQRDIHEHPVVHINTKNGDVVCMSVVDEVPEGKFGLYLLTSKLNRIERSSAQFTQVVFPMIDLDVKPDISWICGMSMNGYYIEQAKQQTRFQMNEKGAKVESGVGMSLMKCAAPSNPTLLINKPFVLWIKRKGCGIPLFMASLCEDVWKEPKE